MAPEVPEGLLKKCNVCKSAILTEDVKKGYYICPKCGGYFRVHAYRRIEMVADPDSFEEVEKVLREAGITMASAEVTMIPQNYVELTDETAVKNLQRTLDLLDEDDDVQAVYHNWDE